MDARTWKYGSRNFLNHEIPSPPRGLSSLCPLTAEGVALFGCRILPGFRDRRQVSALRLSPGPRHSQSPETFWKRRLPRPGLSFLLSSRAFRSCSQPQSEGRQSPSAASRRRHRSILSHSASVPPPSPFLPVAEAFLKKHPWVCFFPLHN